ncbi:MAG: hypothetical protein NTV88_01445 [Candidatus Micrarchaeota archaeon]|nr:hypothetical protein [Candidatus Micrarchaeota archaeon]
MDNESITTQFDDLLSSLKRAGAPLSVPELSARCNMTEKDVVKWLHVLEKSGSVHLENRLEGIYVHWSGIDSKEADPQAQAKITESTLDISIARVHEKMRGKPPKVHKVKIAIAPSDMEMAEVGLQLEKLDEMIAKLRAQKEARDEKAMHAASKPEATISEQRAVIIPEEQIDEEMAAEEKELLFDFEPEAKASEISEKPNAASINSALIARQKKILAAKPVKIAKAALKQMKIAKAASKAATIKAKQKAAPVKAKPAPPQKEKVESVSEPLITITPMANLPKSVETRMPVITAPKAQANDREPIKRPQMVRIEPESFQFSERLSTQVKKIIEQTQEIEILRLEKERILKEHYMPMQRKLDIEVETISDRVLRMEKGILSLQERASQLPSKVTGAEKLQISAIKAHREMRRTYDQASALIEESTRELSEEREKMEIIVDQSRQEISTHTAKREELERALMRIEQMELDATQRVTEARSTLADQAERLGGAEKFLNELTGLKEEIHENVGELKQEIATTKGLLTGISKQMEQMRQVELWAESIRADYDTKMADLDDYIRNGNHEFDTLRESVETNFVRRYLRELRQLTDSYTYEFGQAKKMEQSVEEKIDGEKKKLEGLLEEGRKIAQLYELQSKEVQGAGQFEERGEMFRSLSQIASERGQIESMIAQIVGKRSEYEQKTAAAPIKVPRNRLVSRATKKPKPSKKLAKGKKR